MRLFLDLPIRRKLTMVIILANVVALLVAGTASALYENSLFRRAAFREASFEARLLATACASALARNNLDEARSRLSAALQNQPQIALAQLWSQNGVLLAQYPAAGTTPVPKNFLLHEGYHFEEGYILSIRPLYFNSRVVGT